MRKSAQKRERKPNWLLTQLIASAAIFLLVFVGGGLVPEHVFDVLRLVRQVFPETSPRAKSVEALGEAVSAGRTGPKRCGLGVWTPFAHRHRGADPEDSGAVGCCKPVSPPSGARITFATTVSRPIGTQSVSSNEVFYRAVIPLP